MLAPTQPASNARYARLLAARQQAPRPATFLSCCSAERYWAAHITQARQAPDSARHRQLVAQAAQAQRVRHANWLLLGLAALLVLAAFTH